MLTHLSDQELVLKLQEGCKEAFKEIFQRYSEKAYHLALRITRKEEDAEEIVQDTFLNVFSKIKGFQSKSAFSSWLYRITYNTALMKLRKRKKHDSVPLEENWFQNGAQTRLAISCHSENQNTNYLTCKHELRGKLQKAINALPGDYKTIFILRDIDGLSNQEVSEMIGVSVPAVKSRLHRARVQLKKNLKTYYQDYHSETLIIEGDKLAA